METVLTFLFVTGIVWGGVTVFILKAIKFEKKKREEPQ